MLGELATTTAARLTEYKARKTRYDQRTFRRDEADFANSEGWELVRENQNSDRYQKLKRHDEQLENEFWCLLYNFGYPNLNVGRNFQVEITSNKRVTVSKQIDVFAYDHETIIVAECKSCEKRTILVTNAYHPTVIDLYRDFATILPVERASILSGDKSYRGRTHEALILVGAAWNRIEFGHTRTPDPVRGLQLSD